MRPWRKICCAVDLSRTSEHAVRAAAMLALRLDAELILFHAWARSPPHAADEVLFSQPEVREASIMEERSLLEGWKRLATELRGAPVELVIESAKNAAKAIAAFSEHGQFDLLVLGTHGRHGFGHALLGSVAEKAAAMSPCAVMVVRADAARG